MATAATVSAVSPPVVDGPNDRPTDRPTRGGRGQAMVAPAVVNEPRKAGCDLWVVMVMVVVV